MKVLGVGLTCAALCLSADLTPRVGAIQVFGAYKTKPGKIVSALGVKIGDKVPSIDDSETKLLSVGGVVAASVQTVCCAGRNVILYVGVAEKGTPHVEYNPVPAADIALPQTIADLYNGIVSDAEASLRGRNADEDLTNGYSLMADPEGRQKQQDLIPLVAGNLTQIDRVLRQSRDPEQRQAAAYVIQYAPRTQRAAAVMADALQYALRDPDASVRKIAISSLKDVLIGARLHPDQNLRIEPTWLVELLNSVDWSDRTNAALALITLTDTPDADTLTLIRERAWNAIVDMAQWQDLRQALPGFILVGRVYGMNEKQIAAAWEGDRESFIRELARRKSKRS